MKVLVLLHPDLIPPTVEDEEVIDWATVPWATEYDVIKALKAEGHTVEVLGVSESLLKIRKSVEDFKPNIVFNLLEEFKGEAIFDQNVVSYLELIGVAYTGSNPKGLILARDKALSKKLLTFHRVKTPKFQVFPRNQPQRKVRLPSYPAIVKCLNEESSRGLAQASIVKTEAELTERSHYLQQKFGVDVIAEEFIEGVEYFVGVMGNYRLKVFSPRVLQFNNSDSPEKEFYSENAKYSEKYRERKGIKTVPAELDPLLLKKVQKIVKKTYRVLGLSGYARIDLRIDKDGNCFVLEANPNPDIAEFDDFSESALTDGIPYRRLLNSILKLGRQWSPEKGPQTPVLE